MAALYCIPLYKSTYLDALINLNPCSSAAIRGFLFGDATQTGEPSRSGRGLLRLLRNARSFLAAVRRSVGRPIAGPHGRRMAFPRTRLCRSGPHGPADMVLGCGIS